jgi:hypothetical protein
MTHPSQLHENPRTNTYLRSLLLAGARMVDPGDLDIATEEELAYLTATGKLICEQDHGRRLWRKT